MILHLSGRLLSHSKFLPLSIWLSNKEYILAEICQDSIWLPLRRGRHWDLVTHRTIMKHTRRCTVSTMVICSALVHPLFITPESLLPWILSVAIVWFMHQWSKAIIMSLPVRQSLVSSSSPEIEARKSSSILSAATAREWAEKSKDCTLPSWSRAGKAYRYWSRVWYCNARTNGKSQSSLSKI